MDSRRAEAGRVAIWPIVGIALAVLLGSAAGLGAAEGETFTGTAARTGTYKRPLLVVYGTRYELRAFDKADAPMAEVLRKLSQGDAGTYVRSIGAVCT